MTTKRLDDSRPKNKLKRQAHHLRTKRAKETQKRDFRLQRKREEAKNPKLAVQRHKENVPVTIDKKRRWDEIDDADAGGTGIGLAVDVESLKRRRLDRELLGDADGRGQKTEKEGLTEEKLQEKDELEARRDHDHQNEDGAHGGHTGLPAEDDQRHSNSEHSEFGSDDEDDIASDGIVDPMGKENGTTSIASDAEGDDQSVDDLESILDERSLDGDADEQPLSSNGPDTTSLNSKLPSTTSTALSLIPDALASKFPTLFTTPPAPPKILITTSLHGTAHAEAATLVDLFPNSTYVPRTRHKYKSHHYSLREIAKYASNRSFTTLLVLNEDHKRPSGLTAIHLPSGPTFTFTLTNWVPGKSLPGHGRPTLHDPELILNNFRTPLGLLTAHFFRSLFPPAPELGGRQVVTLHNARDYIFVRRHRYIFREKRGTEKSVTEPETGKAVKGVEGVKAGLQELGPRFTLKLRRVDRGVQRVSGMEWEWRGRMEKTRSKFQL